MSWHTFAELLIAAGAFLKGLATAIKALNKGKGPRSSQDRGGQ